MGQSPAPEGRCIAVRVAGEDLHPDELSPIPLSHSLAASPGLSPCCSFQFSGPWPHLLGEECLYHSKGRSMAFAVVTQGGSANLTFLPFGCFHTASGELWVS